MGVYVWLARPSVLSFCLGLVWYGLVFFFFFFLRDGEIRGYITYGACTFDVLSRTCQVSSVVRVTLILIQVHTYRHTFLPGLLILIATVLLGGSGCWYGMY